MTAGERQPLTAADPVTVYRNVLCFEGDGAIAYMKEHAALLAQKEAAEAALAERTEFIGWHGLEDQFKAWALNRSSPAAEAETSPFPVSPERTTGRHEQRGDWASDPRGAASGVSDTREGDPEAQEAAEFAIADGLDDDVQEGDDRSAVVVDASCEERLRLATEALTAANDGDSIHAFYSEKLWRSLTYWKERAYAAEAQAASPVPAVAEDPKPRCTAMLTRPSPRTTCALVAGHDGPHSFAGREWTDKDKHAIPAGPGSRDTKETP